MAAQGAADAERTTEAPFQGLDALALIRPLGVIRDKAPASVQEQCPKEEQSSESSEVEDGAPQGFLTSRRWLAPPFLHNHPPEASQTVPARKASAQRALRPEHTASHLAVGQGLRRLGRALPSLWARWPGALPLWFRTSQRSSTAA